MPLVRNCTGDWPSAVNHAPEATATIDDVQSSLLKSSSSAHMSLVRCFVLALLHRSISVQAASYSCCRLPDVHHATCRSPSLLHTACAAPLSPSPPATTRIPMSRRQFLSNMLSTVFQPVRPRAWKLCLSVSLLKLPDVLPVVASPPSPHTWISPSRP